MNSRSFQSPVCWEYLERKEKNFKDMTDFLVDASLGSGTGKRGKETLCEANGNGRQRWVHIGVILYR